MIELIKYWAKLVNESYDDQNQTVKYQRGGLNIEDSGINENSDSNEIKKHFDEVIEDIVKEVVSEYKKRNHDIRHYEEYLVDYILERSKELIQDAVEIEEYETVEQLKFFIEQNMDQLIEGFIEDNVGDFDEEGEWSVEDSFQRNKEYSREEY